MASKQKLRPYIFRLVIVLVISVIGTAVFNEVVYRMQKEEYDRAPKTITLTIPAGTAKRIEAGQDVPAIPDELIFVIGDVLEVKNEDSVSHQLGPVWVPPGASGSLVMKQAQKFSFACSFQPTRYLGLDVRQATSFGTRLTALAIASPTVSVLFFMYSLLIFPVKGEVQVEAEKEQG